MTHPQDYFTQAPQFSRMYHGRYSTYAIAGLETLRQAGGYKPRWAAAPDESRAAIAARGSWEGNIWLPPGSVIYAITGSSSQSDGFRLQATEASTGERFFATSMRFDGVTGSAPFLLPEPRIVLEPGLVNVQVTNLAAAQNDVQVVIYYAEPPNAPLNAAGVELQSEALRIRALRASGKLQASGTSSSSYAQGSGAPKEPAYLVMPATGIPFRENASIATPAPGASDSVVVSFRVPEGWDGTIVSLSNQYTGPGFLEGAGDLIWRIRINGAYVKGYDNIRTTIGSAQQPLDIAGAIRVYSGQLVEYLVSHAAASSLAHGASTQIICVMAGWFYAKE